jgi:hypothetical protein
MTAKALALKYLPSPAIKQLRTVKSYLAVCFFRPYEARHNYDEKGSFPTMSTPVGGGACVGEVVALQ